MQQNRNDSPPGASDGIRSPAEIADALVASSIRKAAARPAVTLALSALGGGYIALGGAFFAATMAGADLGFGASRLLGGIVFSMGLGLVLIAGAELFTGNIMMLLAYWRGRVPASALARNWGLVFAGNAAGALAVFAMMAGAGMLDGQIGSLMKGVAGAKMALDPGAAFLRGMLCNMLVCLGVWMSFAALTPTGKIMGMTLPIASFITIGFEHSVANLYLLPAGMFAGAEGGMGALLANLAPVTLGNMAGAALLAALYAAALAPAPTADAAVARAPADGEAAPPPAARPGMPALARPRAAVRRTAVDADV